MGKTLEEAMKITNESVAEELGGLPKNKLHCSNLGADALHAAIKDYQEKQKTGKKNGSEKLAPADECNCPYCEGPLEGLEDYCSRCQIELEDCPECGKAKKKGAEDCPHCGATKVRL